MKGALISQYIATTVSLLVPVELLNKAPTSKRIRKDNNILTGACKQASLTFC